VIAVEVFEGGNCAGVMPAWKISGFIWNLKLVVFREKKAGQILGKS
jgi:hypothetical protein